MPIDPDDLAQVKAALDASTRVDSSRVEVVSRDDEVVLEGAVATLEEATAAAVLAERFAPKVVNELRVDRGLQEGLEQPSDQERAVPAEDEVLIGSTDMLAGPEASITTDMAQAFQENEPWIPPDAPIAVAGAAAEYSRGESPGGGGDIEGGDPDPDEAPRESFSAPDLSQQDLEAAARGAPVPSLDPDVVAPPEVAEPDPVGVDSFGSSPPEDLEPQVDPVPGAPVGIGATGEGTVGGGALGGTPATETGSVGSDAAPADPVRSTGATSTDSGTARGPEARDDPAVREDFPSPE